MDIQKFARKNVRKMQPYSSARDEFSADAKIFLDANENPFESGLNRYPDPYQRDLKRKISKLKSVPEQNILLGNGSDEVLDLIFRAFCEPKEDSVIVTPPTYGMYKVLANLNDVDIKESILSSEFELNADDVVSKIDSKTKLVILCAPNNPTGNIFNYTDVEQILNQDVIVVIDEAYIDFSEIPSWKERLSEFPNLIVSQTFSKAYGMAGARLGMCFASEEILEILNKIKPPYNVNRLSLDYVSKMIEDEERYKLQLNTILSEKGFLETELAKNPSVEKIFPTEANFILIRVKDANKTYSDLIEKGIVVRNRSNQPHCKDCLRITVGTPEENRKLIEAL